MARAQDRLFAMIANYRLALLQNSGVSASIYKNRTHSFFIVPTSSPSPIADPIPDRTGAARHESLNAIR